MSECEGKECPAPEHKLAEQVSADIKQSPVVKMQHVVITLADGRRGVFMGPEFIKEVEMKLGMVPKLVSVDFDPPRAVAVPVPREVPSADSKAEPAGQPEAAKPEDAGAGVEEKA